MCLDWGRSVPLHSLHLSGLGLGLGCFLPPSSARVQIRASPLCTPSHPMHPDQGHFALPLPLVDGSRLDCATPHSQVKLINQIWPAEETSTAHPTCRAKRLDTTVLDWLNVTSLMGPVWFPACFITTKQTSWSSLALGSLFSRVWNPGKQSTTDLQKATEWFILLILIFSGESYYMYFPCLQWWYN